jgi:hypothetical protein
MLNFFAGEQESDTKSTKDHEAHEEPWRMNPFFAFGLLNLLIFVSFVSFVLFVVKARFKGVDHCFGRFGI